ncbi:nickel ABC transporter substrate-binding protein [Desmospora profundinema]|uniref:Peptide/nickel transport system substrate-binding protein n=1 Tax=Desmospora profundinema TaxID=1571184 RepID=A0ABU1ILQ1_9BACL|nr:nickel ABC transporter substrate-binding protein [Desmospora profundinema]MDR6225701.1 peptide/nickel transport system substrate-binding protein [Desmospora profundinema]
MSGSKFLSKAFLYLLVGILSFLTAGCAVTGTDSADQGKKVSLLFSFKSSDLDPHNGFTPLRAGVTETLLRLDEDLQIQEWLATDWKAKDEKTWVFTIRDDVTFHDGAKVDAAAVKASFERGIADSEALAGALKIASMEASGQTLTIQTTEPHPSLPSELVNPYASVVHVKAEEEMGKKAFNRAPVGTGPFKVTQFTPNTRVKLERFDDYWAGKPKLKEATITFNEDPNVRALALQSGEADIAYNLPAESIDAIEKDDSLKVESVAGLRSHFILYNQQKSLMQDRKVRTAFNHLLNRESVAKDIMQGHAVPANGPFHDRLPIGSEEPVVKLDTDQAKALLKKAGYKEGADGKLMKDGKPLTLEVITYEARPELPLMAQLLQSDAAKAGVTIRIKTVEDVDSYLKENNDWDLATYSNLTAPRGDGGYFLNTALTPEGALNQGKIDNPELNDIVKELNGTSDSDKRIQLTRKAVTVVNREVLHSYGVHPDIIVGMNKRIVGWTPGGEEYYVLTHTMDVK